MKRTIWVLAIALLLCGCDRGDHVAQFDWPKSDDSLATALLDSLQVAGISLLLSEDPGDIKQQLWGTFANRDLAVRYSQIEIPAGVSAWPVFRARLIETAKAAGRNSDSLTGALDEIARQQERLVAEGQIFPFGAFIAKQRGEKVWAIPCLWESGRSYGDEGKPRPVRAGHIQIWAFLIENGRQIGYVSCK